MSTPATYYYHLAARARDVQENGTSVELEGVLKRLLELSPDEHREIAELPVLGGLSPSHEIAAFLQLAFELPSLTDCLGGDQLDLLSALEHTLGSRIEAAAGAGAGPPPRDASQEPHPITRVGSAARDLLDRVRTSLADLVPTPMPGSLVTAFAETLDFERATTTPDGALRWIPASSGDARCALHHDPAARRMTVYLQSSQESVLLENFQLIIAGITIEPARKFTRVGPEDARLEIDLGALGLSLSDFSRWELVSAGTTLSFARFMANPLPPTDQAS